MIDLRSDTVTQPSEAMRDAAATAEVGDDVYGEDPTVNELERRAAALLGTGEALYLPSGTMANQVAVRVHTEPGQELLCEGSSHLFRYELGGSAQLAGLQTRPIDAGPRGVLPPETIEEHLVEESDHEAGTGLVAIENTHNGHGGRALAPEVVDGAATVARAADVAVHLDGARLGNAAVAHDEPLARFTEHVDSVMLSLSKGLGAPVGSVLGGEVEFVERARRIRKLYGGGMRQAGIIAAPALLALENVDRLDVDHARASRLAEMLTTAGDIEVVEPETNIVLVRTEDRDLPTETFLERAADEGVLGTPLGPHTARFVTHLDVDDDDIEAAASGLLNALA